MDINKDLLLVKLHLLILSNSHNNNINISKIRIFNLNNIPNSNNTINNTLNLIKIL